GPYRHWYSGQQGKRLGAEGLAARSAHLPEHRHQQLNEAKRIVDVRRGAAQRGQSVLPRVDRVRWEEAQADLIAYYEATGKRDVAEVKSRVVHLELYFA